MKLKYYLRGMGIGILITTIILMIAYSGHKTELTDEEIILRAEALGMVMENDSLFPNSESDRNTEVMNETENLLNTEVSTEVETETETEIETEVTEAATENETEPEDIVNGEVYRLIIPSGSYPRLICNELQDNGVIEDAAALRKYLADMGYATSIKVGEYEIPYGATNEEVYQILKAGPL